MSDKEFKETEHPEPTHDQAADEGRHMTEQRDKESNVSVSRRKLLATVGIAGATLAAGSIIGGGAVTLMNNRELQIPDKNQPEKLERVESFGPVINVKLYGATGDGKQDDTSAIRNALSAVPAGGTLLFPVGTYLVSGRLSVLQDDITIMGQGRTSKIVYTYEQTASDTPLTASLFTFRDGITGVTVKELNLQYTGSFFPKFGESYSGKVNALYFLRCTDIVVSNMEISRFNANAVNVSGTASAYAKRFKVHQCYLHHNRVCGVLFGYVEYISITDCDLDYNGSSEDGGTGYGCAGYSGAMPRHIQMIGNRANYNYRKGLDLHAGVDAIIEGNICHGNMLYGIYAEGPKTGNVTIRSNIISGMRRATIGFPPPYTWITGIAVGPYSESLVPEDYHNYIIEGNQITDFGIGEGDAYPILAYYNFRKGTLQIKNNIIRAGRITYGIVLTRKASGDNRDTKVDITGNQAFIEQCNEYTIYVPQCKQLHIQGNQISTNQVNRKDGVVATDNGSLQSFAYIGNHMEDPGIAQPSAVKGYNESWLKPKLFRSGNFLNGSLE